MYDEDKVPFLGQFYPIAELKTRVSILRCLTDFVCDGAISKFHGSQHRYIVDVTPLKNQVLAAAAAVFERHQDIPKRFTKSVFNEKHNAFEIIKAATEDALQMHPSIRRLLVTPRLFTVELEKQFEEHFKSVNRYFAAETSIDGGYANMIHCIKLATTRQIMLQVLISMVRTSIIKVDPSADETAGKIRSHLSDEINGFMCNAAALAILSGKPQLITEIAKLICHSSMYDPTGACEYSIMNLVTFEGQFPGSYYSEDDKKLRNEIINGYKAL